MDQADNFIRARNNETDHRFLGTRWVVFHRFNIEKRTEYNVHLCAPHDEAGLPRYRKQPDGTEARSYSVEWLFKDDNASRAYAPLRDEPDLFVKFASLASRDPGTRDGREEIMREWITTYGVLGLVRESASPDTRSERRENLWLFWEEVHRAARRMELYEAATGRGRALKRSGLPGKTLAEKRKSAAQSLAEEVQTILRRDCFPKLYHLELKDIGETAGFTLSWGFRSLLGAMYLQLAWRITSRQCEAPGCNKIIGLHERKDKLTCSPACKERRRQHRRKAGTV
jgi:hypothetical protein